MKLSNNELRSEYKSLSQNNRELKQQLDNKEGKSDKRILELNTKYEFILKNLSEEAENYKASSEKLRAELEQKIQHHSKVEEQLKQSKFSKESGKSNLSQKLNLFHMEIIN